MSRVVGSVGQIRVGRAGFTVDLESEICGSIRVHNGYVEVEEVHLEVPMLVEFAKLAGLIASSANGVPCHSSFMLSFAFPSLSRKRHSSVGERDQI